MDNATFEKMKAAQENFHRQAMNIPGVHGTSVGIKRRAGELTREFAICIHVDHKRPLADVPASERIPDEIDGFPTDVIEHAQPEPHEDGGKYRPVEGGIQLQVPAGYGTLGCVVRDKRDKSICALSNQHVLGSDGSGIYQPKSDTVCDKIGHTKRVVLSTTVDGGVSTLDSNGVTATAKIV